jgi:hypothetical protein
MTVSTTLHKNEMQVYIGFRPHDMGVRVDFDGHVYRPEFRLQCELQQRLDLPGPPEFWASDGRRISFDKPAAADYTVHCDKRK